MCFGLHVQYRYFWQIVMKLEFSGKVLKKTQIRNFMKIRLVRAVLFQQETRKRDMTKLIFAIRNFAKVPKNLNI
jgi:hypothetical protein